MISLTTQKSPFKEDSFFSDTYSPLLDRLQQIKIPVPTSSDNAATIKNEYKKKLREIYTVAIMLVQNSSGDQEKKQTLLLLADLLTKFAFIRHDENYLCCMFLTRASFQMQLVAYNILDSISFELQDELNELESALIDNDQAFCSFDNFLLTNDIQAIFSVLLGAKISAKDLYNMGFTLSWMAKGLHHTEKDKEETKTNVLRFNQIYALSTKALEAAGTDEANLELAEVYYSLSQMELINNPVNLERPLKLLDQAKLLNPALEMAIRVAKLKACDYLRAGDSKRAEGYSNEAIAISSSFSKKEEDPFLVANQHSFKAAKLLEEGKLEESEEEIDKALAYPARLKKEINPETGELKDQTHNHQHFGFYYLTKANIKLKQGNSEKAKIYFMRAQETFRHHEAEKLF